MDDSVATHVTSYHWGVHRELRSPLHAAVAATLSPAIRAAGLSLTRWARSCRIEYRLAWQWTKGLCVPRRPEHIAAVVAITGIDHARFEAYNRVAAQPPWRTGRRFPSNPNHAHRGGDRPLLAEHRADCPSGLRCRCFFSEDESVLMDEMEALFPQRTDVGS